MNDILIIDDIVKKTYQDKIESIVLNPANGVAWQYRYASTYDKNSNLNLPRLTNTLETYQFIHNIYKDKSVVSPFYDLFFPVINKLPVMTKEILRIKLNLKLFCHGVNKNTHDEPHVDYLNRPNLVSAIYYVNDSDGDTIFFNEKIDDVGDQLTIREKVSPKKGRVVIFDGRTIHASNNPIEKNPRVVANFNFVGFI